MENNDFDKLFSRRMEELPDKPTDMEGWNQLVNQLPTTYWYTPIVKYVHFGVTGGLLLASGFLLFQQQKMGQAFDEMANQWTVNQQVATERLPQIETGLVENNIPRMNQPDVLEAMVHKTNQSLRKAPTENLNLLPKFSGLTENGLSSTEHRVAKYTSHTHEHVVPKVANQTQVEVVPGFGNSPTMGLDLNKVDGIASAALSQVQTAIKSSEATNSESLVTTAALPKFAPRNNALVSPLFTQIELLTASIETVKLPGFTEFNIKVPSKTKQAHWLQSPKVGPIAGYANQLGTDKEYNQIVQLGIRTDVGIYDNLRLSFDISQVKAQSLYNSSTSFYQVEIPVDTSGSGGPGGPNDPDDPDGHGGENHGNNGQNGHQDGHHHGHHPPDKPNDDYELKKLFVDDIQMMVFEPKVYYLFRLGSKTSTKLGVGYRFTDIQPYQVRYVFESDGDPDVVISEMIDRPFKAHGLTLSAGFEQQILPRLSVSVDGYWLQQSPKAIDFNQQQWGIQSALLFNF
jgi:hypothetical protein